MLRKLIILSQQKKTQTTQLKLITYNEWEDQTCSDITLWTLFLKKSVSNIIIFKIKYNKY